MHLYPSLNVREVGGKALRFAMHNMWLVSKGFITICGLDLPLVLTTSRWGDLQILGNFVTLRGIDAGRMANSQFVQVLQQHGNRKERELAIFLGWEIRILRENPI